MKYLSYTAIEQRRACSLGRWSFQDALTRMGAKRSLPVTEACARRVAHMFNVYQIEWAVEHLLTEANRERWWRWRKRSANKEFGVNLAIKFAELLKTQQRLPKHETRHQSSASS